VLFRSNLTAMVTPSGQVVEYGYNQNGQVSSITVNGTALLSGVTYESFGPASGWTWGNGTVASRTFDADGNVTEIDSGGRQRTYTYDDAFRITDVTDVVTPANSFTYGYDDLDRLTSAVTSATTLSWTYDANGNRLSETGGSPSTYSISNNRNRITAISGAVNRTYAYNAVGSVRTYEDVTVTYNDHGRMRRFARGEITARFVYNALDQRVKRSGDGTGAVLYVYDEAGHLLGEYHGSGTLIQETVWLSDTPVATLRPGTPPKIFYVHADHLNTPRKVTRPSDNKARWTWESDPFGTSAPNESPEGLAAFVYNLRFPGQIYDAHTQLMYNHFRDYDPAVGRYVESDPIGLKGGINTYAYALPNPLSHSDRLGLTTKTLCLNPANILACLAAGEVTAGQVATARAAQKTLAVAAGVALVMIVCRDGTEDCTREIEECSELCAAASMDPDRKHVYGGSMTQCMKNCLPERCGGEPTWKGFK